MDTTLTVTAPPRTQRILYWTATGLLAFGMAAGGLGQALGASWNVEGMIHLGYPLYILPVIGVWKLAGVVVLLIPGKPLLKEWAYAGFFFLLTAAWASHLAAGDGFLRSLPPLVFALLVIASWRFRPAERRLVPTAAIRAT